jgi:hypothetical protein
MNRSVALDDRYLKSLAASRLHSVRGSRKKAGYGGDLRIICCYELQFSCRGAESGSSSQMEREMQKASSFTSSGGCYVIHHANALHADCRNGF